MCSPNKDRASTSTSKPPEQESERQDDTSPFGELTQTSVEGVAQSQTSGSFNSINGIYTVGTNIVGRTAAAAGTSIVNELRPPGTAEGSTDWYQMCTETLGFESLAVNQGYESSLGESISSSMTRMCGVMTENTNFKNVTSFLTTLDSSGRPRFSYERVISIDGQITMTMVETNIPDIVGTSGDDGEPVMSTSHDQDDNGQEDNDEEKNEEK